LTALLQLQFLVDRPVVLFVVTFCVLWLSTWVGTYADIKRRQSAKAAHEDFSLILGATLTLLGLIVGFSFSMAISRYDMRKNYEEAEANAIGTEYLRADLLPAPEAAKVRTLLADYLAQRVAFYSSADEQNVPEIDRRTARLQQDLWVALVSPSVAQPTPVVALAVAGMNDVLNSQGYTQAAFWNRMPLGAWSLMMIIAVIGTALVGYGVEDTRSERKLQLVLPCVLAVTFMLIADIDSPRGGLIRVIPQNLLSLADGIRSP
jgi:hypothetical protein